MTTAHLLRRRPLWMAVLMAGAIGAGAAFPAQGDAPTAAPNAVKAVPPSTTESAESAFAKLAGGKGHVSREEARSLEGFEQVFDAADADHDERLSPAEFKKAWDAYRARDKSNRG